MVGAHPGLRASLGLQGPAQLWWGIQPISAGVFGVPAGLLAAVLVSLLTPRQPASEAQALDLRRPPRL
jgi:cation/acetate symporter